MPGRRQNPDGLPDIPEKGGRMTADDERNDDRSGRLEDLLVRHRRRRPLTAWLSILLLLAAVGALGWFAWTAGMFASKKVQLPNLEVHTLDARTIEVRNTKVTGLDEESQPFVLRAKLSRRPDAAKNKVFLEDVSGTLRKTNGEVIAFRADRAVYFIREEEAELIGNVRISSKGRYELTTPRARLILRTKEIETDAPVVMRSGSGVIRAHGMKSGKGAGGVTFSGGVQATFGAEGGEADMKTGTQPAPAERDGNRKKEAR